MSNESLLVLDPAIRNWVVLPLVVMMLLMGLLRFYIQQLLKSEPKHDLDDIKVNQTIARAQRLRRFGRFITPQAYEVRKHHLCRKDGGELRGEPPLNPMANPMMNPVGMMDAMKGNISYIVPNLIMMTFISYFFSGFVLAKVPFGLTNGFKVMLQRGVDLSTLDVSYVSSLSWYFLLMYGLRSVFKLVLGEESVAADEARMMQMQMGRPAGGGMMGATQPKALFKAELTALQIHDQKSILSNVEKKLLGDRYPSIFVPELLSPKNSTPRSSKKLGSKSKKSKTKARRE